MFVLSTLAGLALASHPGVSDDDAIHDHLHRVETSLRAADVSHLSASQRDRRADLLDVLQTYRSVGVFPHNPGYASHERPVVVSGVFPDAGTDRTPVFVDGYGTHCAVGYLLAADGREELVERIVDGGNLRYVHEIDEPELLAWAVQSGFTVDELARIQPAYGFDDLDDDGWTRGGGDCNDNDDKIHPDADEVCGDAIDNNCDGDVDEEACVESGCSAAAHPAGLGLLLMGVPLLLGRRRR